jgi:hypothetical protein
MDSAGLNRGHKTEAGCYNADPQLTTDPNGFFGQAQLRLSSFIRRFAPGTFSEHSICDAQSYPSALSVIANNIIDHLPADCLPQPVRTVGSTSSASQAGTPECVVGYVDASNPRATPDVALPACSARCCNYFATDPAPKEAGDTRLVPNPHLDAELAACSADPDCYCAVPSTVSCQGGTVVGVWRSGNAPPPPGKLVSFQCAVTGAGA